MAIRNPLLVGENWLKTYKTVFFCTLLVFWRFRRPKPKKMVSFFSIPALHTGHWEGVLNPKSNCSFLTVRNGLTRKSSLKRISVCDLFWHEFYSTILLELGSPSLNSRGTLTVISASLLWLLFQLHYDRSDKTACLQNAIGVNLCSVSWVSSYCGILCIFRLSWKFSSRSSMSTRISFQGVD